MDAWLNYVDDVVVVVISTSPDLVSPEVLKDDNGLSSPLFDAGAFFTSRTISIKMS